MTPERESLEGQLKTFEAKKKAAKNVNPKEYLGAARGIVETIQKISKLSTDNVITDWQVSSYCWALYACVTASIDAVEQRQCLTRLVVAYSRKIDASCFWGEDPARESGKLLFKMIIVRLYKILKETNETTVTSWVKAWGGPYCEILTLRAKDYLDEEAFHHEPVTDEQRQKMEKSVGGRIRMKVWPSLAEKAFGILNRCLKVNPALKPDSSLANFLDLHIKDGEWFGFYCANLRVRLGDYERARPHFIRIVRRKPNEAWIWEYLASTYRDQLERAASCLCKALICPFHDQTIAQAMTIRIRHQLAHILLILGRTDDANRETQLANLKELPKSDDIFYREMAQKLVQDILGVDDLNAHGRHKPLVSRSNVTREGKGEIKLFEGKLIKQDGNAFGFVNDKTLGRIFIPPNFAADKSNGDLICGKAQLKEDKKRKKLGYCMIFDL